MQDVKIYTTSYCPFCTRAKQLFQAKNVVFEEIDLGNDDALRQELVEKTDWMTVPMVFVGDTFIGGYDETCRLDATGELDRLLEAS